MALPELTPEQRSAALSRAAVVRKERAEVLKKVTSGEMTVDEVFEKSDDVVYGRITAKSLVKHLPGIGAAKSVKFFEETGILPERRVAGLGIHQREKISEFAASRFKK